MQLLKSKNKNVSMTYAVIEIENKASWLRILWVSGGGN
jgi:hypothetical protein